MNKSKCLLHKRINLPFIDVSSWLSRMGKLLFRWSISFFAERTDEFPSLVFMAIFPFKVSKTGEDSEMPKKQILYMKKELVPTIGFEPTPPCEDYALNVARLPVPPCRHSELRLGGWINGCLDEWLKKHRSSNTKPAAHSGKPLSYSNSFFLQAAIHFHVSRSLWF